MKYNPQITAIDSLFNYTGILELNIDKINFNIINNPQDYDLSSYKIKIIKNSDPMLFNQYEINKYIHAQHKLRIITYNYGKDYFEKYIIKKNGAFIEQHEFIQMITPLKETCDGYVISGKFIDDKMVLIAFKIPFGYTLLIEPHALHGDSSLIGLYSMAMTGNHYAMATANTVLIKNKNNGSNVKFNIIKSNYLSTDLLLSCDKMSVIDVKNRDNEIKQSVKDMSILYYNIYTGYPFFKFDKIYQE